MFCKYCGNQVPDGYVCNCTDAQAARAAAAAPVATAAPAAAPAAGNDIGKVVGDAFKSTPNAFKSLLNNNEGFGINLATTVVLAVAGLILNILAWILMVAGIQGGIKEAAGIAWTYIKPVFDGMTGYGILGGLWTCIVPIALSMVIVIVGQLIRKEQINIVAAFTTGTCINIAPAVIFLVGALFTTFLPAIGIILILVGIIFALAANYKLAGKFIPNTNGFVGGLIAAAVVAVVLGLMAWIVYGVITGYVEELGTKIGAGIGDILGGMGGMGGMGGLGDLGDLGDLLGGF
jgi:hypothetical protein